MPLITGYTSSFEASASTAAAWLASGRDLESAFLAAKRRWGSRRCGWVIALPDVPQAVDDALDSLAQRFRARGPSMAMPGGPGAGAMAVQWAVRAIRADLLDAVLVVGLEHRAAEEGEASPFGSAPTSRRGCGLGMMLLERQGEGIARLETVADEMPSRRVDWILCGADGQKSADEAYARLLAAHRRPVVSLAGAHGRLGAASFVVGLVAAVEAIERGAIPATEGTERVDPSHGLDVPLEARRWESDRVAVCQRDESRVWFGLVEAR